MTKNIYTKMLDFEKLFEKNLKTNDFKNIKKFTETKTNKEIFKKLDKHILNLKSLIKDIDIDDICFSISKYENYIDYETTYDNGTIESEILIINTLLIRLKNMNIDIDDYSDYNLKPTFSINHNNFNKCDLVDGIPKIYRNVGLGKKIIKKLILDYGYISFQEPETSDEMKSLQYSIATKDKDIYSFLKNEQLIMFNKDLEYSYIENILINYFDDLNKDVIKIDSDFKKLYSKELKDSKLNKYI